MPINGIFSKNSKNTHDLRIRATVDLIGRRSNKDTRIQRISVWKKKPYIFKHSSV